MPAAVMHAVVIAKSGERGGGLGEAAEDIFIGGIVANVGIVDVVAGEADEVGLGGNGERGDVVQVTERDGGAQVKVREVDEAHGAGKSGKGDAGVGDLDAPLLDETGVDA